MNVGVHVSLGRCKDIRVYTFIALYITPNLSNALGPIIFVSVSFLS